MTFSNLEFNQHGLAQTRIKGAAGDIEVLITRPENISTTTPIAVICHPHPLYGGSMTNKVVHILAKTFTELGAISVRFNFRGVGNSEGVFDNGIGEAEDLQFLLSQLRSWQPRSPVWLAGFSFGAYVAARAQPALKPEKLLLVAPPVSMYDFDALPEIETPWAVIQGAEDEVIDANAVKAWVSEQKSPPRFIWMDNTSHFFHGKLNDVKDAVLNLWKII